MISLLDLVPSLSSTNMICQYFMYDPMKCPVLTAFDWLDSVQSQAASRDHCYFKMAAERRWCSLLQHLPVFYEKIPSFSKMNILKTPEDSTAFVRIMGEFDQFLSNNPKGRLTYEDYSSETRFKQGGSSSSSRVLSKSRSQGSLLTKEREKDVELIKSRSKIVQLESEMNSLESERKRARIEFEKDAGNQKLSFRRLEEKYDDLQQNFLCIAEQEKNAKDQLKEVKKEYEIFRNKSEKKLQNLQREKLKACAERDEVCM